MLIGVGDWVQIQNQNDLTKPIVAQIYRTWQDAEGQNWVNACWYYRPEQTVHRYERHFFENEVVRKWGTNNEENMIDGRIKASINGFIVVPYSHGVVFLLQ